MKKMLMVLLLAGSVSMATAAESKFSKFVYREGDRLMDENGEYRFIGFNVPCLHYNEDNMPFTRTSPWRLTDEFEITDALESVRQMGGNVIRIYTLSIRRPEDDSNIPRHVLGPGKFNEEAYKSLDMTLAIANRKGVRVIFPFIDNARWWGGVETIAAFRGKERADFWTDPNLFEDYKIIVRSVVERTNTITGVKYKDDKAILAWETGNELNCPPEWTIKAAAFIKSIDPNHLVLDGFHLNPVRELSIEDKNVDIVTSHYYPIMFLLPVTPAQMISQIKNNAAAARGKKVYFVGEFGFIPTNDIEKLLQTVKDENLAGALIWSLRFHDRDGGFYYHSEPYGGDKYKAYHWPGFASGEAYDETRVLDLMRRKSYEIRNMPVPAIEKPAAPVLLDIKYQAGISWQGSAGASGYDIERAESKDGPWVVAGSNISDADLEYRPLFNDTGAEIGKSYYYRVTAKNSAGVSGPSNIVGPITVAFKTLTDEMQNFKFIGNQKGALSIETNQARKFKEDSHRLKGEKKAYIVYKVGGPVNSWKVYSFFPVLSEVEGSGNVSDFNFYVSADGQNFKPIKFLRHDYFTGKGDYNYYLPVLYTSVYTRAGLADKAGFLKIEYSGEAQISRVEIKYGK